MPEWVTRSLTILERQTIHFLDMRKPLLWCSVACFLLMLTSIDFFFAFHFLCLTRELCCYSWMLLELIFYFLFCHQICWATRCTWEASTQWCCTEGKLIYWYAGEYCIFRFRLSARGHNLHFSVYAITFSCSLLYIIIVPVLVRIDLTMNSPFL
jgi:hypothetical protein